MTRRILDGRNRWMATVAATIAPCLLTAASPARAADSTWINGHTGSWFDSVNWDNGVPTAADVAFINNGSATIGGAAGNSSAIIGDAFTSIGTVSVDGTGSSWTLTGLLSMGNFGTGTLKVSNGATVSDVLGVLGSSGGTSGTAIVDGKNSSWTTTGALTVGGFGNGALTVSNGGAVSNSSGIIGDGPASNSTATVDGKGSSWTNTNELTIGNNGSGALTVSNGGTVSSSGGVIGNNADSHGAVIVDGKDSSWTTNTGRLVVGSSGTGALTVSNGGAVSSADGLIGFATTGTVIVDGTGSRWTNTGEVNVGGNSIGVLTVSNGGAVSSSLLNIAFYGVSTGTINIGAAAGDAAAAPGVLDTTDVHFGSGAGKLVFNHTASDYVFAPKISSDTGNNEVDVYAGTTILTAANTYTGPTNIFGGALLVNGSIVSPATVSSGATFGGAGTVGDTTVKSGGTFAPGNGTPGSSITVAGSLAFESGARYLVQVNPSMASSASVSGTATLTGAMVEANFAPGVYVQKQYTILTAATLDGTFAGLTGNAPAGTVALDYGTNDVFLNITLGFANAPVYSALNVNQRNVADTLNNYFNTTGGIPGAFFSLSPQGLSQVSGELATGSQQATFDAMNMFMGVMTDPFMAGRGGNAASYAGGASTSSYAQTGRTDVARDAYAAIVTKAPPRTFEEYWSVWGAGYGGSQTTSGNAAMGSNTTTSQIYGGAAGADYHLSPDTMVGFALGGGGTNFSVANSGAGRSDLFQAGAFARHEMGAAYITAAFAYGWQNITTDRTVTAAGVDRLHASFDANAYSGRVESGWRFVSPVFGGLGLTPYAAGQVTLFDLPSYGEQALSGSNQFALSYASKDATATRSELGLRADKSFAVSDAIFTLRGRAAWAHNFDNERAIGATFQTLPGASFVVNGAAQASDSALISASAETRWLNGWSLAGTFEGEFSSVTNSYAGKGVVKYAW